MTFQQELSSWNPFSGPSNLNKVPEVGEQAPAAPQIKLPRQDGKPVVISFLRHCGCPFAEKAFKQLRKAADEHSNIHFIAVSHSDKSSTDKWLQAVDGAGKIEVIVDHERKDFAQYGLGASSFWAVLNPWSMGAVFTLSKEENLNVRPTESGSRWQTAGLFAVDGKGTVVYSHKANTSDDLGDLSAALDSLRKNQSKL